MRAMLEAYAAKCASAGLAAPGGALFAGLDSELEWNRQDPARAALEPLFNELNINSLALVRPAEPYAGIVDHLAARADVIAPRDCETRTFLHDLPVVDSPDPALLVPALKRRKGAVVRGLGVVAHGTVSPEQCFVTASSMLFSCFVKFFADLLDAGGLDAADRAWREAAERAADTLPPARADEPDLIRGPFESEREAHRAMIEAGRATVEYGLVDSYFGNISYMLDGVLHISQTGSSLDDLAGYIDPCPVDAVSCAGLTASSELTAHLRALARTGMRAVLHGHPRFTVVLSMHCGKADCPNRGACHVRCREKRLVCGVPVVPGEVGSGPSGLCNTLPEAFGNGRAAVVWGHGLFALGEEDFRPAFASLLATENACRERCLAASGLL